MPAEVRPVRKFSILGVERVFRLSMPHQTIVVNITPGLRDEVLHVIETGRVDSADLRTEINVLRHIPMDDTVAERPHAIAKHHGLNARAGKWPWVASSCRHTEALNTVDELEHLGGDLQTEWNRFKSLLQPTQYKAARNIKMSRKQFETIIYGTPWACEGIGQDGDEAPDDDGFNDGADGMEGGDDDIAGPQIGDAGGGDDEQESDAGEGGQDDDGDNVDGESGQGGGGPIVPLPAESAALRERAQLFREYFGAVLRPYMYISHWQPNKETVIFQILSLQTKVIKVATWRQPPAMVYSLSVQRLDWWRRASDLTEESYDSLKELDVFRVEEPVRVDAVEVFGPHLKNMREWTLAQSDVEGCQLLRQPAVLQVKVRQGLRVSLCSSEEAYAAGLMRLQARRVEEDETTANRCQPPLTTANRH